jgi:hypothetical protein
MRINYTENGLQVWCTLGSSIVGAIARNDTKKNYLVCPLRHHYFYAIPTPGPYNLLNIKGVRLRLRAQPFKSIVYRLFLKCFINSVLLFLGIFHHNIPLNQKLKFRILKISILSAHFLHHVFVNSFVMRQEQESRLAR